MKARRLFSLYFLLFVSVPVLLLFVAACLFTLNSARENSVESIRLLQEGLKLSLETEMAEASARLSQLAHVNGGEVLALAALSDTERQDERNKNLERLYSVLDFALPPSSEVLSVCFRFKSGRKAEYKSSLPLGASKAFESLLASDPGNVHVTAFHVASYPELYMTATGGNLVWVAGLSPGGFLDHSGRVEGMYLFQLSSVYQTIVGYDAAYASGRSHLGYTAVLGPSGEVLSSSKYTGDEELFRVVTELEGGLSVVTEVRPQDLFLESGCFLLLLAVAFLLVALSFFFFLRLLLIEVINPLRELSDGLESVEHGDLNRYLRPRGAQELQVASSSFNAMARRLRALVSEYEERLKLTEHEPERLLSGYVDGKLSEKDLRLFTESFLSSPCRFVLLGTVKALRLSTQLDGDPEFSSRAVVAALSDHHSLILCKEEGPGPVSAMLERVLSVLSSSHGTEAVAVMSGCLSSGHHNAVEELEAVLPLLSLAGLGRVYQLAELSPVAARVLPREEKHQALSKALRALDQSRLKAEKDRLLEDLQLMRSEEAKDEALSVMLSVLRGLGRSREQLFSLSPDFLGQVSALEDTRSVMLLLTGFLTRTEAAIRSELNGREPGPVEKARRYIEDNYQSPDLSLTRVADYVGLNERYLSTLFSRETGETFISYLTGLRLQRAASLLRRSNARVYEIARLCGYQNPENFNKAFRKHYALTPTEYRKMNKEQDM